MNEKHISLSAEPFQRKNMRNTLALKKESNTVNITNIKKPSSKITPLDSLIMESSMNNTLINKLSPQATPIFIDSFNNTSLAELKSMRKNFKKEKKRLSKQNVILSSSYRKSSFIPYKNESSIIKQKQSLMNNTNNTSNAMNSSKINISKRLTNANGVFALRNLISLNNVYDSLSDDDQEGNERILSQYEEDSYIINPNTLFYHLWNLIISFSVIYSITISPLSITIISSPFLNYCEGVIDIFFIMDIIINFFTPYYIEEFLIKNRKMIIMHYLTGWFFIDFCTAFPFELIVYPFKPVLRVLKLIQKLKWLKILRLGKFSSKKDSIKITTESLIVITPEIKRLLFWLGILAIALHISACLWAYLGVDSTDVDNWLYHSDLLDSGSFSIYVASLYFIASTFMTVGYGDIVSYNSTEVLYNCILILVGVCIFSFALSILSKIFESLGADSARIEEKMNTLKEISAKYHFNPKLTEKIQYELKKTTKSNKPIDNKYQLFEFLPSNVKQKLIPKVHIQLSNQLSFFDNTTTDFVIFTLPMLKQQFCNKNDYLFSIGERVDAMFLVVKGVLSLKLGEKFSNFEIGLIKEGNHFGEIQLHFKHESPYDLKAKKYSSLLSIKKNDFMRIKENYNEIIFPMLSQSLEQMELFETRRGLVQMLLTKGFSVNYIKVLLNKLTFILFQEDFNEYYYHNRPMRELYSYIKKLKEPQLLEFISLANMTMSNGNGNDIEAIVNNKQVHSKESYSNFAQEGVRRSKLKETITQYKSKNIVKEILTLSHNKSVNKDISSNNKSKKFISIISNRNFSIDKETIHSKGITLNSYCEIDKMRNELHQSRLMTNNQKQQLIMNLKSLNEFQKNKLDIVNSKDSINNEQLLIPHQTEIKEIKRSLQLLKEIFSFYKIIAKKQKVHFVN